MRLHEYVNAIFDIAHANDKDIGVAKDMFLTNIRNSGVESAPYYGGAEYIHYDMLKEHLHELEESQDVYANDVREHYQEIVKLRNEGKLSEVIALLQPAAEESEGTSNE